MKILYVTRGNLKTDLLKQKYHSVRRSLNFRDQDGFFEQSLYSVADVDEISVDMCYREDFDQRYDFLVVNWKQPGFSTMKERFTAIKRIVDKSTLPKVLFINAANANYLPENEVLDAFDYVIKREPFTNRDKYNISEINKTKIIPTIIHCPFYPSPKDNLLAKVVQTLQPEVKTCGVNEQVYDVGFSGADAAEHTLRQDVWRRVKEESFNTIGGLQPNPYTKLPIPEGLAGPRFTGKAYRDSLCQAKINLALKGIGEYTFRHQELLYLGVFMMSDSSIRDLDLVIPLEEDKHYVTFDSLDEMVEKIKYYLEHEEERLQIARSGKRLFDEYYNPKKHGQELLARLKRM